MSSDPTEVLLACTYSVNRYSYFPASTAYIVGRLCHALQTPIGTLTAEVCRHQ